MIFPPKKVICQNKPKTNLVCISCNKYIVMLGGHSVHFILVKSYNVKHWRQVYTRNLYRLFGPVKSWVFFNTKLLLISFYVKEHPFNLKGGLWSKCVFSLRRAAELFFRDGHYFVSSKTVLELFIRLMF